MLSAKRGSYSSLFYSPIGGIRPRIDAESTSPEANALPAVNKEVFTNVIAIQFRFNLLAVIYILYYFFSSYVAYQAVN